MIDIGANIGIFSAYAANPAYKGKVYAYEPVSANFEQLKEDKRLNRLDNLSICKLAVSDKAKDVNIWLSEKNMAGHSIYKYKLAVEEHENAHLSQQVRCVSLKDIIDQNGVATCNCFKIDCEGAEHAILRGLPREYFSRIEKIALEYHQVEGESCWDLAEYLNDPGYFVGIYHWKKNFGMMYAYSKKL